MNVRVDEFNECQQKTKKNFVKNRLFVDRQSSQLDIEIDKRQIKAFGKRKKLHRKQDQIVLLAYCFEPIFFPSPVAIS